MKTSLLLAMLALLLGMARVQAQEPDTTLAGFGQAFVNALAQRDPAAMKLLMVTEMDARATMALKGVQPDVVAEEMRRFQEAQPKMQARMNQVFGEWMKSLESVALEKARLVKVEKERPSNNEMVEKTDLLVYFKIKGKQYVADVDDCVLTVNGWRLTSKFDIQPVQ